ncbi:protein of unknown function [Methanocaldococcus lauensis]|nr:protein of unknown function [Methanocaldococcus lauensis]
MEYDVAVKKFLGTFDENVEEFTDEKLLMDFLNEEKIKNKMTNKLCIGIFEKRPWSMFCMVRGKDIIVGINKKMINLKKKAFEMMLKNIVLDIFNILIKNTINNAIYLPASKSGLILSSGLFIEKFFESSVIFKTYGKSKRSIELEFPEPVKDFMKMYLHPHIYNPDINQEYQDIALLFENNIIKGELVYDKEANKITYTTKGGNAVPFHCASSSVVETIPLLKLLKYSKIIKKGTLLIIEEPEAHLHPDAQRIFARAITKLINKGVYVFLITHSPYILQQINNNMKLHYLGKINKEKLYEFLNKHDYKEDEILNPEKVAPYLFVDKGDGVIIKELEIIDGEGISYEAFYHTLLDLHKETEELRDLIEGDNGNFEE